MIGRHQIIDLGWTDDELETIDAYTAADFFVMPSTAEAFGMMAIEAMACGKPVICFDGTSLPEVTFAPRAGISVPMGDIEALAAAMKRWIEDPNECQHRGLISRQICEQHYGEELQGERLTSLYKEVVARRSGNYTGAHSPMSDRC